MSDANPYDIEVALGFPSEFEAMLARTISNLADLMPNTLMALSALAIGAQKRWIALASGEALPDGRRINRMSGGYAESIQIRSELENGNTVRYVIFSDSPLAAWLEWGTDAWDMHKMLETSRKVKLNKAGKRYLSIPFRWGGKGSLAVGGYAGREIPQPIVSWWAKNRTNSMITGSRTVPAVQGGGDIQRLTYQWGDRLTAQDVTDLGLNPNTTGRNLVGMVRMRNPDNARLGSQKLTFRTLSESNPDGWMHPGTKAYGIAASVADWLRAEYPAIIEAAMDADVQRLRDRVANIPDGSTP